MDWLAQSDIYCERTDLTYWAEPINALTNTAFLIAAIIMWRRSAGVTGARILCVVLAAIGIGSYLWHTHATNWASLSDVAPIGIFILTYLFLVNRDVAGWPLWIAIVATLAFIPYAAVLLPILDSIPFIKISNFYWTVPILLLIYGMALRNKHPLTARGFIAGAALLTLSITLRSIDEMLCARFPIGTHFLWHGFNGLMLGYMIEVYLRHVLAARLSQR